MWKPGFLSTIDGGPLISDDEYIPRPSFSAADRDRSMVIFSCEVNLRKSGLIFALLLELDFLSGEVNAAACALAGTMELEDWSR